LRSHCFAAPTLRRSRDWWIDSCHPTLQNCNIQLKERSSGKQLYRRPTKRQSITGGSPAAVRRWPWTSPRLNLSPARCATSRPCWQPNTAWSWCFADTATSLYSDAGEDAAGRATETAAGGPAEAAPAERPAAPQTAAAPVPAAMPSPATVRKRQRAAVVSTAATGAGWAATCPKRRAFSKRARSATLLDLVVTLFEAQYP